MDRRRFLTTLTALGLAAGGCSRRSEPLHEVKLDWAYYSPLSMVLRQKGWLEEAFRKDGVKITWVLSLGSNKALEFLSSSGVDFGSSAGAAALLSRANGNPVRTVYVSGKPEWTALVTGPSSAIGDVTATRGKKVAATKGTDPYIFFLRLLHDAGMSKSDVDIVHLQHPDGRAALERGDVDAWAGLDPHMAYSEIERGSRLAVRKPEYNSYSVLNVREAFLRDQPEATHRVLEQYERARKWALGNREELLAIVSQEAKIPREVATRVVLQRYSFENPVPGAEHTAALLGAASVLTAEALFKPGVDGSKAVAELLDPSVASTLGA
jgi:sulfonate transport system substrate-binding protein